METLRQVRAARCLTQAELAALAGVRCATVGTIERGQAVPTPKTMRRLATALGVAEASITEFSAAMQRYAAEGRTACH